MLLLNRKDPTCDTVLGCQLDSIRNKLQSRNGGLACDLDLEERRQQEAGRCGLMIWILRRGRHTFHLGKTSTGIIDKDNGRRKALFVLCLLALALSAHPFFHWQWNLFLQNASIYRRPAGKLGLVGPRNYDALCPSVLCARPYS